MGLSNDLISQFVKVTKDDSKRQNETSMLATIVEYNGKTYAKLDGSDLLTPITTTVDAKPDERVTVTIKNHQATITGNITSPAARTDDVKEIGNKITEVEILVADKVSTTELDAVNGRIDNLVTDNVVVKDKLTANEASIADLEAENVTIKDKLTANEAAITKLQTDKLDAAIADITYATITDLEATNADIHNLEATYGDFVDLTTDRFTAIDATIGNLDATYATIKMLEVEQARIGNLEADVAVIDTLQADVADIETLMFGSASGNVIQTSFANAVIAQLGNAQIKSAMIENVSADKITAGDIITNNVRVMSEDGSLVISDETIQITDGTRVRVQIGKDSANDYSINIWDADGKLMFSEGGITDSAIKEAIIRNDMVSNNANISASKLDINSLFEEINGSAHTIKSTKIYLDDKGQTLDVAFTSVTTEMGDMSESITSQGTQISTIQGQISSKVWQQDINTATNELEEKTETLSTKYSSLEQTVNGISATVASHTTELGDKANESDLIIVRDQVSELDASLTGFKLLVSDMYATKTDLGGYYTKTETEAAIELKSDAITSSVRSTYATKQEVEELEIGGTNLIQNSNFADGINKWEILGVTATVEEDSTHDWCLKIYSDAAGSIDYRVYPSTTENFVHDNGTYALSFYAKADASTTIQSNVAATTVGSKDYTLTTEWQRFTNVYDATGGSLTFWLNEASSTVYITKVKVEYGDKATTWCPSPEDVDSAISDVDETATDAQQIASDTNEQLLEAESVIEQLADSISMLVTDENGSSLMTQTENGWTFDISHINNTLDSATNNIDSLTESLGGVDNTVQALEQAVNDLGVLTDYIIITTYNGQPCIELGETENNFKLRITNTDIQFIDGSAIPAYLSNQKLYIENAEVTDELQFGGFVWKVRSNGNMGLMWKEVTE